MLKIGDKVKTINPDLIEKLEKRGENSFTIKYFTDDKFGKRCYVTGKNRSWMYEELIYLVKL